MMGATMNGFDIALVVLVAAAVVFGLLNGLVRILIGLAALLVAFVLAARYHAALAGEMPGALGQQGRSFAAYLLILLGVMLVAGLVGWIARRLLDVVRLGWADRLGGAALGLVGSALFAAFVVVPIVAYAPSGRHVLADSRLAPYVAVVADIALRLAPPSLSSRYESQADELRRGWRERFVVDARASRAPDA